MSDLFNLYVKAGSPHGNDQPQSAQRWAADEIITLRQKLEQAEARCAELEADAARYRFVRDNQYWQRKDESFGDPAFDLVGVKFEKDNGFTAKAYLDHAIDNRARQQATEIERGSS